MHFTCPEEHFYNNIMLTLWNNFGLWAKNRRIRGGKIAALLIKLLFCLQMGNWKNSFESNFTFSDFFRTTREQFLVFSVYHSRHGGPNWIPQAKRNISIRKNFVRKLFVLSGLWAHFLNIHWSLFGMLSKLEFTCSLEHFEKGYFFRIFQKCLRFLSDNRPDLWRKVSALLPKLHSTRSNNFSIFLHTFVMFHLTSCSSEKKSYFWKKSFVSFVKIAF